MKTKLALLAIAMSCTFAVSALALTKAEYKTQKDLISSDYKLNKSKCDALKANAKDVCVSEAKGVEKVSKAELEAQYKPSTKNTEKVSFAKSDSIYNTAKEKCDDFSGKGNAYATGCGSAYSCGTATAGVLASLPST